MPTTWVGAFTAAMERWDAAKRDLHAAQVGKAPEAKMLGDMEREALAQIEIVRQAMVSDFLEMLRQAVKGPSDAALRDLLQRAVGDTASRQAKRIEDLENDVREIGAAVAKMATKLGVAV